MDLAGTPGDAGSLLLGFMAGAMLLLSMTHAGTFRLIPASTILFVPAFDCAFAMLRRRLQGRSMGEADRAHIHHRLKDRGLSTPRWNGRIRTENGS